MMQADKTHCVNAPHELKVLPQWVAWKSLQKPGKTKPDKIPFNPKNDSYASSTDALTWGSFEQAFRAYGNGSNYSGIGFAFNGNGIVGIDLDKCLDPDTGELDEWAEDIVSWLGSYTEISPSGTGVHIFIKSDFKHTGVNNGNVEIYTQERYFTVTGNLYDEGLNTLEDCSQQHRQLYEQHKSNSIEPSPVDSDKSEWTIEDQDLYVDICKSKQGVKFEKLFNGEIESYPSQSEADMGLCSILAFWCNKDSRQIDRVFRQSELYREKWDERHGKQTYGQGTIGKAIARCEETRGGNNTGEDHDISIREWPVLDQKALHGYAGRFVEFATQNSEADQAAVLITLLVRFGVEVPNPTMWVGDTKHKANVSSVIVGSSSKARKGTSGKPVMRLFEPLTFESDEIHNNRARMTPGPFSSGEGIIYAVRDAVMGVDKKTGKPIEVDPGVKDKRLFVLDEEFAGVMVQTKREGNILSMIIRCAWDGNTLDPLTKTSKIRATRPHIGWISHITLFELILRLSETEMFNGYANRILWVCARRSKLVAWPPPMDMEILSQFQYELSEIIEAHQGIVQITPDNEVRKAWEDKYYRELTEERPGLVGCVVNRAEAQVMRLALIYCLLDKCHIIRIEHLEAALALWNYCEASANYIFDGRQQDNISQNILDSLQDGVMSGTDIHRLFNSHVSKERLKIALSELEAAGKIGTEKQPTKGRPVTTYFLKDIGIKSVISVKTSDHSDKKPLNTLFTLNTQGNSENDLQEYEEII